MSGTSFRHRNVAVLTEAQNALNVAFGAILSAYIGNSLTEIDNRPFDHAALARFFIFVALFILGLCVGNSVILRGEYKLGAFVLAIGGVGAVLAHHAGREIGFEVVVLRLLAVCWIVALLGSNAVLTLITYVHHRSRP
jgi:small-conductance mechanosensitive channel